MENNLSLDNYLDIYFSPLNNKFFFKSFNKERYITIRNRRLRNKLINLVLSYKNQKINFHKIKGNKKILTLLFCFLDILKRNDNHNNFERFFLKKLYKFKSNLVKKINKINNSIIKSKFLLIGFNEINLLLFKMLKEKGFYVKIYDENFIKKNIFKHNFLIKYDFIIGNFQDEKINFEFNQYIKNKNLNLNWLFFNFNKKYLELDIFPVVNYKKNGCYWCYSKRLEEAQIYTEKDIIVNSADYPPRMLIDEVVTTYSYVLFLRILKLINIKNKDNNLWTLNFIDLKIKKIKIINKNNCNNCKNIINFNRSFKLKNVKAIYKENGLRAINPRKTLLKLKPLINKKVGLIVEVDKNYIDKNIYFYSSISADPHLKGKGRLHFGKGLTDIQNKVSALMEAIERYAAKFQNNIKIIRGSYKELKNVALNPELFILPRKTIYNEQLELDWVEAFSLSNNKSVLVPLSFIYKLPKEYFKKNPLIINFDNTGLASGNLIEEAILQGIFEVIERDAYTIMELNKLNMPDVDFNSIKNNDVRKLLYKLDRERIKYYIKNITNDIPITTFNVFLKGHIGNKIAYSNATGTHLDPNIALLRALTEAIQLYPHIKEYSPWLKTRPIDHLMKKSKLKLNFIDRNTAFLSNNIKNNIDRVVNILKGKGCEIIVYFFNLEIDFKVVKVLITKLQPSYCYYCFKNFPRYSNRIFELPKKLGYKKSLTSAKNLTHGQFCGFQHKGH